MVKQALRSALVALTLLFAVVCDAASEGPLPPRPTVTLQVGDHVVQAEVVSSADDRARGLMHRVALAPESGMLFVFGAGYGYGEVCMWMRNTLIALSAAFLDAEGRVINIADMRPRSETIHCAQGRARFVLELNQGAFAAAGVTPGARIGGLPGTR